MYYIDGPDALLWDEYKYRHDHIWQKLFQITIAGVLMNKAGSSLKLPRC